MKITKQYLKKLVKEELGRLLKEQADGVDRRERGAGQTEQEAVAAAAWKRWQVWAKQLDPQTYRALLQSETVKRVFGGRHGKMLQKLLGVAVKGKGTPGMALSLERLAMTNDELASELVLIGGYPNVFDVHDPR